MWNHISPLYWKTMQPYAFRTAFCMWKHWSTKLRDQLKSVHTLKATVWTILSPWFTVFCQNATCLLGCPGKPGLPCVVARTRTHVKPHQSIFLRIFKVYSLYSASWSNGERWLERLPCRGAQASLRRVLWNMGSHDVWSGTRVHVRKVKPKRGDTAT